MTNDNGDIMLIIVAKLSTGKAYVENLFENYRNRLIPAELEPENGLGITTEEVKYALKNMKNGKTPGPDELPIAVIQLFKKNHLKIHTDFLNLINKSGAIPNGRLRSTFLVIPKKTYAKLCKIHRIIILMSHKLKLCLKLIQ